MRVDVDSGIPGIFASRGSSLSSTERSEALASRRVVASHDPLTIREIASATVVGCGQSA